MSLLVIQNISHEGPGLLAELIAEHKIRHQSVDLSQDEHIPNPTAFEAVVVLGGPQSANDQTESMQMLLSTVKKVLDHNITYLGICLGMQVLAHAAGGDVVPSPVKEVGWRDQQGKQFTIKLTDHGEQSPLFAGLHTTLPIFHLHGETIEHATNTDLLATGEHCRIQAIKVHDHAFGIQGHFELTEAMFNEWCSVDPDLQKLDQEQLQEDYRVQKKEYEETGKKILINFLKFAKLI